MIDTKAHKVRHEVAEIWEVLCLQSVQSHLGCQIDETMQALRARESPNNIHQPRGLTQATHSELVFYLISD